MSVPEAVLAPDVAARLPDQPARAPWTCRLCSVFWVHRALPGARDCLPAAWRGRGTLPVTLAAFVRYEATPVGPYSEVLASPLTLLAPGPAGHVPFIAVDSLASVLGGRANWALPKVLASVAWERGHVRGAGDDWSVEAAVRVRPRAFPVAATARDLRVREDGTEVVAAVRGSGVAQLASVDVRVAGPSLPAWLASGRHPAVVLRDATVHVGPARPRP